MDRVRYTELAASNYISNYISHAVIVGNQWEDALGADPVVVCGIVPSVSVLALSTISNKWKEIVCRKLRTSKSLDCTCYTIWTVEETYPPSYLNPALIPSCKTTHTYAANTLRAFTRHTFMCFRDSEKEPQFHLWRRCPCSFTCLIEDLSHQYSP